MPTRVLVPYTSDNGTTYQRHTLDDIASALSLTPEAIGAHAPLPRSIKARYVLGRDPATGREHKLVGIAASNAHWTGATNTIDVPDPANRGSTLTLNIAGRIAERRYAR